MNQALLHQAGVANHSDTDDTDTAAVLGCLMNSFQEALANRTSGGDVAGLCLAPLPAPVSSAIHS